MSRPYIIDSDENSDYMYNVITKIVNECGPRAPCSEEEKKASNLVAETLKNYCDEVNIENFSTYPRAFLGFIRLCLGFWLLSFLLFLIQDINPLIFSISSLIIGLFVILIIYKQFFNYEEFIPRFLPYKRKISQNVIGIIKPESKNIKKRVIFSAHIDSAFRFNLIEFIKHGYAYFIIIIYIYLILFLLIYVFQIFFNIFHISFVILIITLNWIIIIIPIVFAVASLIVGRKQKLFEGIFSKMSPIGAFVILIITFYNLLIDILFLNYVFIQPDLIKTIVFLFFIAIPTFIAMLFFVSRKATPGVIDNLTGVAPFICLAKILKEWKEKYPNLHPQNTEVIIAIVGCEEVGLRGAEAFARKHAKEYNKIDSTCVNIDSLTESRWQTILKRENTTRTDLSPEVYDLLAECCEDLGIKHQIIKLSAFGGGTDAVGLIRGGLKAASLMGMRIQDYLYYYHTNRDNLNLLNKERRPCDDIGNSWKNRNVRCAMENALKICIKYLEKIDKK